MHGARRNAMPLAFSATLLAVSEGVGASVRLLGVATSFSIRRAKLMRAPLTSPNTTPHSLSVISLLFFAPPIPLDVHECSARVLARSAGVLARSNVRSPASPGFIPTLAGLRTLLRARTPALRGWKIESTNTLVPANWQPMLTLTNVLGLPLNIVDTGQSGRLLPTSAKTRYYRLVPF